MAVLLRILFSSIQNTFLNTYRICIKDTHLNSIFLKLFHYTYTQILIKNIKNTRQTNKFKIQ